MRSSINAIPKRHFRARELVVRTIYRWSKRYTIALHSWGPMCMLSARSRRMHSRCGLLPNYFGHLSSTHADRQGVDISVNVCSFICFVCTVTNFSCEDKASGVKFCTVVHGRPEQGISHFRELCFPRSQHIGRIGHPPRSKVQSGKSYRNRVPINIVRRVDVGSTCVDIRPSPITDVQVLVKLSTTFRS